MMMRRSLQLMFWPTLVLSGVALWPQQPQTRLSGIVAAVEQRALPPAESALPPNAALADAPGQGALPEQLPERQAAVPGRDPFAPVAPPPSLVQPVRVVVPLPPPLQQEAVAPNADYRFLGRMRGPDGHELTLLTRGEVVTPVAVGNVLADGYRVDAIEARFVRLSYPSVGTVVDIAIPASPSN
jgi:hypothetical protein